MSAPVGPATPPPDPTSLATSNFNQTMILNRLFKIILGMVSSLQNAAASQANRLTFMSRWQAGYTDGMSQVHTFITGDPTFTAPAHRDDANRLNSGFIQTMQNRQSVVSDNAKSLQSNINQSNDAVNQQSNLGTAILQELGTLLGAIFK
jgi:hypothetical protein